MGFSQARVFSALDEDSGVRGICGVPQEGLFFARILSCPTRLSFCVAGFYNRSLFALFQVT